MKVSIILVNFNRVRLTLDCVASIRTHAPSFSHEIIVVDNRSTDREREDLKRNLPDCTLVFSDRNLGFGGANNLGATRASGEMMFFLNNDTILTSDIFTHLTTMLERNPNMGLIGPSLRNPDNTFQVSFGRFPSLVNERHTRRFGRRFNHKTVDEVGSVAKQDREWITGAAMMVRKECFDRVGGFDTSYFMYFEDVDLCYRARQLGYEIGYSPDCSLVHLGGMSYASGESRIRMEYRRSQLRFYDKFRTWPERFLLRAYLLIKVFARLFNTSDRRDSIILALLLFRSHGSDSKMSYS